MSHVRSGPLHSTLRGSATFPRSLTTPGSSTSSGSATGRDQPLRRELAPPVAVGPTSQSWRNRSTATRVGDRQPAARHSQVTDRRHQRGRSASRRSWRRHRADIARPPPVGPVRRVPRTTVDQPRHATSVRRRPPRRVSQAEDAGSIPVARSPLLSAPLRSLRFFPVCPRSRTLAAVSALAPGARTKGRCVHVRVSLPHGP